MSEQYLFQEGLTKYGYTNTVLSRTLEGIFYKPSAVERSGLNITGNYAKMPVTLKFPRTNSFILSLVQNLPEDRIRVTIFRDSAVYWEGYVVAASVTGSKVEVSCDSVISSLQRNGLHTKYTLTCRHVLYSPNCSVDKYSFSTTYFLSLPITSTVIDIPAITDPSGFYSSGIAEIDGQTRGIVKQEGTVITLTHAFSGTPSGNLVLFPGCRLTEEACTAFSNLDNFGGFSRVPPKNPFESEGLL